MRAGIALIVLAACGGGSVAPVAPRGWPNVQLVRCAAATPPPHLATADEEYERVAPRSRHAPTVTLGKASAPGIAPVVLEEALRGKLPALTSCYRRDPAVTRAVIQYKVVVAATSARATASAGAGALGTSLNTCVAAVLGGVRLPPTSPFPVTITVPLVFDLTGRPPVSPEPPSARETLPWTPFGSTADAPSATSSDAARAAEAAMRARLQAISRCFVGAAPVGSLRVMLELGIGGELRAARVGGLGDATGEACVARALDGLHVLTPVDEEVELACDLARGEARPWRVTPDAGYEVIRVEPAQLRHGTDTLAPGAGDFDPRPPATYLVIARPDSPGALLQLALLWASDAARVVLAVGEGTAPPVYLGIGDTTTAEVEQGNLARASVRINGKTLTGCVARGTHEAKLSDEAAVSGVLRKLADKCRDVTCDPTLLVGIDSDAVARDLLELAGAARRAGFERVLFGGSELGCGKPVPPKKKTRESELDFDLD